MFVRLLKEPDGGSAGYSPNSPYLQILRHPGPAWVSIFTAAKPRGRAKLLLFAVLSIVKVQQGYRGLAYTSLAAALGIC